MSDAFRNQMKDPRMKDVPFEDCFGILVDIEYSNCKSNSLKCLIHNVRFDQPDAYIGNVNDTSGRKPNYSLIERLTTCEYITEHRNLFVTGATGNWKTYLACVFGMEACKQRYKTKYVRLLELLLELEMARNDGTYKNVQGKYANPILLLIDEWLLMKPRNPNSMIFIFWSFYIVDAGGHLPSSVPGMMLLAGMISWVVATATSQRRSWTASSMMHTRLALS